MTERLSNITGRQFGARNFIPIICGYGCEQNPGYDEYLASVTNYLFSLRRKGLLNKIITCGGYTNPKYPELSEASYIAKVIQTSDCDSRESVFKVPVLVETVSTTTPENLANGCIVASTTTENLDEQTLVLICDKVREFKVTFQIAILTFNFLQRINWQVRSFKRPDDHFASTPKSQIISLVVELPLLIANKGAFDAHIYHQKLVKPALIRLKELLS